MPDNKVVREIISDIKEMCMFMKLRRELKSRLLNYDKGYIAAMEQVIQLLAADKRGSDERQ